MRAWGVLLALGLGGCVSAYQNSPTPTATESELRAHACERAAALADLRLPRGARATLHVTAGSDLPGGAYCVAAFRAHAEGRGVAWTDDDKAAAYVVELRVAAASIDDVNRVLGLPAMVVPSIGAFGTPAVSIPELAVYAQHARTAAAEMSAVALDARTGRLVAAVGPVGATTSIRNHRALLGVVWGDLREGPGIEATSRR